MEMATWPRRLGCQEHYALIFFSITIPILFFPPLTTSCFAETILSTHQTLSSSLSWVFGMELSAKRIGTGTERFLFCTYYSHLADALQGQQRGIYVHALG